MAQQQPVSPTPSSLKGGAAPLKISLVTVCLNAAATLPDTLESVLSQNYPNLEYLVLDGGSTDGSRELLEQQAHHFAYWRSAPDEGHHAALQEGLARCTGELMGWINADDLLMPGSLWALNHLFQNNPQVQWLTGAQNWISAPGYTTRMLWPRWNRWSLPRFLGGGHFAIQQESTFWRRSLWERAGGGLNPDYRVAFDFELWTRFFLEAELHSTPVLLGGFRHTGAAQQSVARQDLYQQEMRRALQTLRRAARRRGYPLGGRSLHLLYYSWVALQRFGRLGRNSWAARGLAAQLQFPPEVRE